MHLKIRTRLTLFFAVLVGAILTVFSAALYLRVSRNLERDFVRDIESDGRLIAELFKEESRLGATEEFQEELREFDFEILVRDQTGAVVFQSERWAERGLVLSGPLLTPPEGGYELVETDLDGRRHAVYAAFFDFPPRGKYHITLLRSKESLVRLRNRLLKWIMALVPFMVVLGAVAGFLFSQRALAPVDGIRKQADRLDGSDLSSRLPYPPTKDELYFLTDTLNRALDRIEAAFGKLNRFTADASHELRIPLTALRGGLEVALAKERSVEDYRRALEDALEEAENISRLVQDLLVLARADAGRALLNLTRVAVGPFTEELLRQARAVWSGADVSIKSGSAVEVEASMDEEKVRRCLLNLIDNGVKYNRAGGWVEVSSAVEDGKLVFTVADNGEGIPPEHQEKIFDRFFRVDKARSRETGGTGLGLSIARWIAEAHGGRLSVKSLADAGSSFRLELPLS